MPLPARTVKPGTLAALTPWLAGFLPKGLCRCGARRAQTRSAGTRDQRMQQSPPADDGDDDQGQGRRNVMFLVVAVVVVLAGVWLVNRLLDMRNMQNCLASGRTNCAPISVPGR